MSRITQSCSSFLKIVLFHHSLPLWMTLECLCALRRSLMSTMMFLAEVATTNELAERIVDYCLPIGLTFLAIGAIISIVELLITAAKGPPPEKPGPQEHGSLDSAAKLAVAFKDLNAGGRLLITGLALVAFAATAAGADALGGEAEPAVGQSEETG